jgi:hypothetical protein
MTRKMVCGSQGIPLVRVGRGLGRDWGWDNRSPHREPVRAEFPLYTPSKSCCVNLSLWKLSSTLEKRLVPLLL